MEALDNVRDEMTMLFLNSNQNQMEFPFLRKSGMEVIVRVSQTYLVPEYVDLDHEDDSPFFFQDEFVSKPMKTRMRHLQQHYCRLVIIYHHCSPAILPMLSVKILIIFYSACFSSTCNYFEEF